jgi:flagellar basal body-associated protein FliL
MIDRIKNVSVLLCLFIFVCCSSEKAAYSFYSFEYVGTLSDSGTVKMSVDIECQEENDVVKIKKNIATIKRALSMTFLRQETEDLKVSGGRKVENSLYKIIQQFANAECKKIKVVRFEIVEK